MKSDFLRREELVILVERFLTGVAALWADFLIVVAVFWRFLEIAETALRDFFVEDFWRARALAGA